MDERLHEVREVHLGDLVPFQLHTTQIYQGERLEQLVHSIERVGLMNPITVRLADDRKYEIIYGHNRTNAMGKLGRDVILADVWEELSDETCGEGISVQSRHKSSWNSKRNTRQERLTQRSSRTSVPEGNDWSATSSPCCRRVL